MEKAAGIVVALRINVANAIVVVRGRGKEHEGLRCVPFSKMRQPWQPSGRRSVPHLVLR